MERRLNVQLPRWVKEKLTRQKAEEDRERATALEKLRISSHYDYQGAYTSDGGSSSRRLEARRRGKRAKLARRGKPTHNFRIYR